MSSELGIITYTMNYNHLDKWLHSISDWKLANNGREQDNGHIHNDITNVHYNARYLSGIERFANYRESRLW